MLKWALRAAMLGVLCGAVWLVGALISQTLHTSPMFDVKLVEVRGAVRTDIDKLKTLYSPMVGQNIFREITSEELMSDDPWIQRLEIKRVFPSKLVVLVVEEKEQLAYKSGKLCYALTESSREIERECGGVRINIAQTPLASEFREFLDLYKRSDVLRNSDIVIKNGFFTLNNGLTTFVSTYETDIFESNYKAFTDKISPRYKTVERVDVTVRGRVYVKGVRNG